MRIDERGRQEGSVGVRGAVAIGGEGMGGDDGMAMGMEGRRGEGRGVMDTSARSENHENDAVLDVWKVKVKNY